MWWTKKNVSVPHRSSCWIVKQNFIKTFFFHSNFSLLLLLFSLCSLFASLLGVCFCCCCSRFFSLFYHSTNSRGLGKRRRRRRTTMLSVKSSEDLKKIKAKLTLHNQFHSRCDVRASTWLVVIQMLNDIYNGETQRASLLLTSAGVVFLLLWEIFSLFSGLRPMNEHISAVLMIIVDRNDNISVVF